MCLLTFRAPVSKQQQNREASSRATKTPPQSYDLLIVARGTPASVAPTKQETKRWFQFTNKFMESCHLVNPQKILK